MARLLLPLMLAACTTWEGRWLLTVTLEDAEGDNEDAYEDSIGIESDGYATMYAMADGTATFDTMPGTASAKSFAFEKEVLVHIEDGDCTMDWLYSTTFEGDFSSDLGLSGEMVEIQLYESNDCGDDEELEDALLYGVEGIHLDAGEQSHPMGSFNYGPSSPEPSGDSG